MKFHEKLLSMRKKKGLSQEELGMELQVSRQTISKWEAGQSYPDFQKLVILSDYFGTTVDELIKDVDVQEVREKTLTDEKVALMFSDTEKLKSNVNKFLKIACAAGFFIIAALLISFIAHLLLPEVEWLWRMKR
ncbi:helix-turn-helix domain-containing protein [Allofournierella sp.]|uniref:helix-turn-helix domain-containing protein n=1 Tax=Allofournierella sp. TaxID=1940256 RepID=UPI003AB1DB98